MGTVLVTGASRGIGLELARQYAADGWQVLSAARAPEKSMGLRDLSRAFGASVSLETLDVTSALSIEDLAERLRGRAIDLLINNAAVYPRTGTHVGQLDYDVWADTFETNLFGAMRLTESLLENVATSERKQIVAISSGMGSLSAVAGGAAAESGTSYQYRTSKTALNMAMLILSKELAPRGISVAILSPGWVQTDMGGAGAAITPEVSVAGIKKILGSRPMDISGKFLSYDGSVWAW